ncbi:MAG TPA: hypothetical protein VFO76_13835 [Candidatus Kapabacteria bacterium]|nr:hypothetical protein [Candidatus Kapabacteria bacterium]
MKTTLLTLTIAVFFAASFIACSSSSETTPTQSNHRLKTGDAFTYHQYDTELDGTKIDGSDTTVVATIVGTNLSVEGRTDVAEIHGVDTVDIAVVNDSMFWILQHEVAIAPGCSIPPIWIPFDTKITSRMMLDSTIATKLNGMNAMVSIKVEVNYTGKGTSVINGKTFTTENFDKIVTVVVSIPSAGDFTTVVTITNSFSPELGYLSLHAERSDSDSQFAPFPNGVTVSELTGVSLK